MVTAGFSPSKSSARWVLPRWILLIYLVLTVVPLVCHECSSPVSKFSSSSFDFGVEFVCWIPRDDKGDVSVETMGPAQAVISAVLQTSAERLAVLLAYP
ncbi:hypothetical protein V6N12_013350 [Hibiscus sabdariffa]|uniref:Uncharacterized protein n=1 Tax=Hibiscus sabdariffa TaxID=183260 RepID=A0ABR2D699_9ROSI